MSDSGAGEYEFDALGRLAFELTLLSRHYTGATPRRAGHQLERSAFLILTRLELEHALSLRELAEAFRLDISTLNRQVAAMSRQQLVVRVPDPDGGVARKVQASAKGLALLAADRALGREGLRSVVSEWSEPDLAQLGALISRFNRDIEAREENPWPRPAAESIAEAGPRP
ncbi:MarR family winged helix-turn-helix transcriptional regulator [Nocardia sp. NPDC057353]|uniref:MarR family winged helix-turn-helix transcriptional regulator n=1 Tax=Nocardia sp. NPDC057353 TaxID=3346104 RepID=UPI003639990A